MNAAAGTTTDDVVALLAVVPDRYHAAIHLGAGEGVRLGEVLGFEDGSRCLDPNHSEIHVVHRGPAQSVTSICQTSPLAYRTQGRSRGFAPWRSCSPTTRGGRSTTNVRRTWKEWRKAAGWPDEATFHSLRHYADLGRRRPDRRAEGATSLQPAHHPGDLRARVAEEAAPPQRRRDRTAERDAKDQGQPRSALIWSRSGPSDLAPAFPLLTLHMCGAEGI